MGKVIWQHMRRQQILKHHVHKVDCRQGITLTKKKKKEEKESTRKKKRKKEAEKESTKEAQRRNGGTAYGPTQTIKRQNGSDLPVIQREKD